MWDRTDLSSDTVTYSSLNLIPLLSEVNMDHTPKEYDVVYFFFSSYEYLQSNQKSQQYLGNKMHSPI